METPAVATRFADGCREIFKENLVGVYLHGSLAMGCWNSRKSDVDLLVVTQAAASREEKRRLMELCVALNAEAPEKGLEMSVVRRDSCERFVHPTPFDLHFSPAHLDWCRRAPEDYIEKMNGVDPDLAAHFTVTRARGIALCGAPVAEVFGEVPREAYLDSILGDIAPAEEDILRDPVYVALNLCRVLAYAREGLIASKREGGMWALSHAGGFAALIHAALESYADSTPWRPEPQEAAAFCAHMHAQIENAIREGT